MRCIVSKLFWETSCILKLQWDPSKDPTIDCGYKLDPSKTSQSETAQLLKECEVESQAPTLLYISLEILTVRMGTMKTGKLGAGPGSKKLARQVAETVNLKELINSWRKKTMYIRIEGDINLSDKNKFIGDHPLIIHVQIMLVILPTLPGYTQNILGNPQN